MKSEAVLLLLSICIVLLVGVILYQRFAYRAGLQRRLKELSRKLNDILDGDTDEHIMVFTDNKALIDLAAQINRLLDCRQRLRAEFRRSEISSKKMLSNISHDIKTPMTVILGYLEIMRLNGACEGPMLAKVEGKAKQVMELINQFFTLAKLEAGDTDMTLSTLNVTEACREIVLDFYELLTREGFRVDLDIPEDDVCAQGNAEALRRILFNLISNVMRYGAQGKYLGLALHAQEDWVRIDVTDHGKGIEPGFAATVFDRLFTMEDSRNRAIQGNGLGLTIAKSLAVQMGGDITLTSEPYVRTTFSLRLKKPPF